MQYRITFTTRNRSYVERFKALNGKDIDALAILEEEDGTQARTPDNDLQVGASQADRVLSVLSDGMPHRSDELMKRVYGSDHLGMAALPSRVSDLRAKGHNIPDATRDPNKPTLYWYQLLPKDSPTITL